MTRKQQIFIDCYVLSKNGTQSAIKAGYSKRIARQMASQNLSKQYIIDEIDKRFKEIQDKLQITDGKIIEKLWDIANNAEKETDRVSALKELASIRGMKTVRVEKEISFKPPPIYYNRLELEEDKLVGREEMIKTLLGDYRGFSIDMDNFSPPFTFLPWFMEGHPDCGTATFLLKHNGKITPISSLLDIDKLYRIATENKRLYRI